MKCLILEVRISNKKNDRLRHRGRLQTMDRNKLHGQRKGLGTDTEKLLKRHRLRGCSTPMLRNRQRSRNRSKFRLRERRTGGSALNLKGAEGKLIDLETEGRLLDWQAEGGLAAAGLGG